MRCGLDEALDLHERMEAYRDAALAAIEAVQVERLLRDLAEAANRRLRDELRDVRARLTAQLADERAEHQRVEQRLRDDLHRARTAQRSVAHA